MKKYLMKFTSWFNGRFQKPRMLERTKNTAGQKFTSKRFVDGIASKETIKKVIQSSNI